MSLDAESTQKMIQDSVQKQLNLDPKTGAAAGESKTDAAGVDVAGVGATSVPDASSVNLDPKTSLNLQDLVRDTVTKAIAQKSTEDDQASKPDPEADVHQVKALLAQKQKDDM